MYRQEVISQYYLPEYRSRLLPVLLHLLPELLLLPEPAPEPAEPPGEYPCPCCGYLTFPVPKEEAIAFICPVCFWENDVFDPGEDDPSDENHGMTLRQGRENYRKWGAMREDFVRFVRPPRPEEIPEQPK